MSKNGKLFFSLVCASDFVPSVWDPYVYRANSQSHTLSHYAAIRKVTAESNLQKIIPFDPVEYRDIPRGHYLSFALRHGTEPGQIEVFSSMPIVGEGELLFGTMRAYLGNVLVTPMAEWVGQESPIYFQVKSEFVAVSPHDELPYFWMAYMRSTAFLENLPIGSGGTRPRLQPKLLEQVPVTVPPLKTRCDIHNRLKELACAEWQNYLEALSALALVEAV